jgi:hypothetical protein
VTTTRRYCTLFDATYLARGRVLYDSLVRHAGDFVLDVLCLDALTQQQLTALQLPQLRLTALAELEAADAQLAALRRERAPADYIFTLTPYWIAQVLRTLPKGGVLHYVDADLAFFADPTPAERELGDGAVLIVPHRFATDARRRERNGIYNVGYLSFRHDADGLACVDWWRAACLDWCQAVVDGGRYADQGYLNQFPQRFARVRISMHPGVNLARWNVAGVRLRAGRSGYLVDGQPLIVYHFSGLARIGRGLYDSGLTEYGVAPTTALVRLYGDYFRALLRYRQPGQRFGRPHRERTLRPRALLRFMCRNILFAAIGSWVIGLDLRRAAGWVQRRLSG